MSSNSTLPTPTPTPGSGTGGSSSNSTSPATDPSDCAIVRQFKFTPSVVTPSQPSCCSGISMRDVRCSTNNRVTFLVLYGTENNLQAGIPESVGQLDALETFELYNATGTPATIPPSISRLTNLKLLNLVNVSLTGSIPDSFGNMKRLEHLGLNTNELSGSVPSSIGSLTALKKLYFYENQLTSIPDNLFANMPYLEILAFHRNRLSGKLPSSMANLKQLEALSIRENRYTGIIPTFFNDMPELKELYLGDNDFTGVPDPFMPGRRMYSLRLDGNRISGALPILPYTNDTCRIDGPDDRNNFVCSRATSASDQLGECYKLSEVRGLPLCTPGQVIPTPVDTDDTSSSGSFSTGLVAGLVGAAAVAIVAGFFLYHRRIGNKPKPTPVSVAGGNGGGPEPFGYNAAPTSSAQPPPVSVAHTGGSSTVGVSQTATWTIPTASAPPTLTPPPGYQTNSTPNASALPTPAVAPATPTYPGGLASYNPYSKPTTTASPDHQQRPQSFALPSSLMMPQPPTTGHQRPQSFASPATILMPNPEPTQQPQPGMAHMPQPSLSLAASPGPASPTFAPNQHQQPLLYASNTTPPATSAHPYHAPLPHVPSAPPMPGAGNIASPLLSATGGDARPTSVMVMSGGIEMQAVDKDDGAKAVDAHVTHVATFDSSTLALPGRPPAVKEEDETLYLG